MIDDKSVSGKELRLERLEKEVSRRRMAFFRRCSEERIVQIEKKSYVRPDAVKRYRTALAAAVEFRSVLSDKNIPKGRLRKNTEVVDAGTS